MSKKKKITIGGNINPQGSPARTVIITQPQRFFLDMQKYMSGIRGAENVDFTNRIRLYDMYEDILIDGHLSSVRDKRIASARNIQIEFRRGGKPDEEINVMLRSPWFFHFIEDLVDSVFWGFSLFQFYRDKSGWINYELIPRKNVDPVRGLILHRQGDIAGTPWTDFRDVLFVGKPRALGKLANAAPYVIFKRNDMADWAQFCEIFGIKFNSVPLREDFSIDVKAFEGIKDNITIANPNAQTGIYLPVSDIKTLLSADKDRLVIIDEAYCDFGGESALGLLDDFDNLIVVQTMSKSRQLAGGRVGFAIASEAVVEDLNKMKFSFNPYNLNRLSILAGAAAISDEEYFEMTTSAVKAERERLKKTLAELGFFVTPSLANFVLAAHPKIGGKELYLALKEKGVLVRFLSDEALKPYVRITVGSKEQNDALTDAIKQIIKEKGI